MGTNILTYRCASFKNKNSSASINGLRRTDRRIAKYVETTDTRITNAITEIQFMTAEKQHVSLTCISRFLDNSRVTGFPW